jgi:hypothetical protein
MVLFIRSIQVWSKVSVFGCEVDEVVSQFCIHFVFGFGHLFVSTDYFYGSGLAGCLSRVHILGGHRLFGDLVSLNRCATIEQRQTTVEVGGICWISECLGLLLNISSLHPIETRKKTGSS